jgi:hypothetical protein
MAEKEAARKELPGEWHKFVLVERLCQFAE